MLPTLSICFSKKKNFSKFFFVRLLSMYMFNCAMLKIDE